MRKYWSLIGVLLVLVAFNLGPKAEALDRAYETPYVSPALLLGMNFDSSGDDGLESYPSLSTQITVGYTPDSQSIPLSMAGMTFGYQWSSGHPNNLYIDFQGGIAPLAGVGVGWAWQPSTKESSFRCKLFWPFALGLGIEYDSRKRLKSYLYTAPVGILLAVAQAGR